MNRSPDPDAPAVELARAGDTGAFGDLVRKHQAGVFGCLVRMCRSRADAEDLAQETFIRAWEALPGFKGRSSFRTWLFRIATNRCLNHLTRRRPLYPLDESFAARAGDEPEEAYRRRVRHEAIDAALGHLPPDQRLALLLSVYERLSYREIAAVLGRSEVSVSSLLYRARNSLRARLRAARDRGCV